MNLSKQTAFLLTSVFCVTASTYSMEREGDLKQEEGYTVKHVVFGHQNTMLVTYSHTNQLLDPIKKINVYDLDLGITSLPFDGTQMELANDNYTKVVTSPQGLIALHGETGDILLLKVFRDNQSKQLALYKQTLKNNENGSIRYRIKSIHISSNEHYCAALSTKCPLIQTHMGTVEGAPENCIRIWDLKNPNNKPYERIQTTKYDTVIFGPHRYMLTLSKREKRCCLFDIGDLHNVITRAFDQDEKGEHVDASFNADENQMFLCLQRSRDCLLRRFSLGEKTAIIAIHDLLPRTEPLTNYSKQQYETNTRIIKNRFLVIRDEQSNNKIHELSYVNGNVLLCDLSAKGTKYNQVQDVSDSGKFVLFSNGLKLKLYMVQDDTIIDLPDVDFISACFSPCERFIIIQGLYKTNILDISHLTDPVYSLAKQLQYIQIR